MRSFWSEPFLWLNLAGLAVVPLTLELVWLGLAIGNPLPFFGLELIILILLGILPMLWLQWYRPFYIFSLFPLVVKPDKLTLEQRKILAIMKSRQQRFLTVVTALLMLLLITQIYRLAPLATIAADIFPSSRLFGLALAVIALALGNLFIQVPMSVVTLLLFTSEEKFAATEPIPVEKVKGEFTILGLPWGQILPVNLDSAAQR